ncbi:hypothetical protein N8860_02780 [Alphaproteobacteria bacterium]|nr:hypothetical protein [Alphaproteobacteria bacterium]
MIDAIIASPELSLSHKGNRRYVQGADIWQASEGLLQKIQPTSFVEQIILTNFAFGQCEIQEAGGTDKSFGKLFINDGFGNIHQVILVDKGLPLKDRVAFNEDDLWTLLDIRRKKIVLRAQSPFSFHETVVSMAKVLSYEQSDPHSAQWVFVRATMEAQPPRQDFIGVISIELLKMITGRFVQFGVTVDGTFFGFVYFGVASP